jgi:hypothetical protein
MILMLHLVGYFVCIYIAYNMLVTWDKPFGVKKELGLEIFLVLN